VRFFLTGKPHGCVLCQLHLQAYNKLGLASPRTQVGRNAKGTHRVIQRLRHL
jgi:hypothetical protein